MKKRIYKNKKLDELGANLLKASAMPDEEIEKILAKPELFDSVLSRIKVEQTNRQRDNRSGKRDLLPIFAVRKFVFAAALAGIFIAGAAIIFYNRSTAVSDNPIALNEPPIQTQTAKISSETVSPVIQTPIKQTPVKQTVNTSVHQAKIVKTKTSAPGKTKPKLSSPVRKSAPVEQMYADDGVFYALPFADLSDGDAAQIFRTELSRAELFALGIEFPLTDDDEDKTVVTDLIYGVNGNPKAFRLVSNF